MPQKTLAELLKNTSKPKSNMSQATKTELSRGEYYICPITIEEARQGRKRVALDTIIYFFKENLSLTYIELDNELRQVLKSSTENLFRKQLLEASAEDCDMIGLDGIKFQNAKNEILRKLTYVCKTITQKDNAIKVEAIQTQYFLCPKNLDEALRGRVEINRGTESFLLPNHGLKRYIVWNNELRQILTNKRESIFRTGIIKFISHDEPQPTMPIETHSVELHKPKEWIEEKLKYICKDLSEKENAAKSEPVQHKYFLGPKNLEEANKGCIQIKLGTESFIFKNTRGNYGKIRYVVWNHELRQVFTSRAERKLREGILRCFSTNEQQSIALIKEEQEFEHVKLEQPIQKSGQFITGLINEGPTLVHPDDAFGYVPLEPIPELEQLNHFLSAGEQQTLPFLNEEQGFEYGQLEQFDASILDSGPFEEFDFSSFSQPVKQNQPRQTKRSAIEIEEFSPNSETEGKALKRAKLTMHSQSNYAFFPKSPKTESCETSERQQLDCFSETFKT